MHPSRYLTLIEGVSAVFITGVHPIDDQNVALRLVSLTDRLYDAGIPGGGIGRQARHHLLRGDAGRRLPQEVSAGHLTPAGADQCGGAVKTVAAAALIAAAGVLATPVAAAQTAMFINGMTPVLRPPDQEHDWHLTELGGRYANDDIVTVDYPASAWPFTRRHPTMGGSVAQGVVAAKALVKNTSGPKVVIATSQGTLVADQALADLAADSHAPPKSELSFVIVADPLRPGGILSGLPAGIYIPILDYTTRSVPESQYDIVVLKQEYDGIADFPDRPLNLLADANALAGIVYLHFREHDGASYTGIPETGGVTTVSDLAGKTTTYLLPTENLPLTQPLRDLGVPVVAVDALDRVLRPVIDSGYARNDAKTVTEKGPSIHPGTRSTARAAAAKSKPATNVASPHQRHSGG